MEKTLIRLFMEDRFWFRDFRLVGAIKLDKTLLYQYRDKYSYFNNRIRNGGT